MSAYRPPTDPLHFAKLELYRAATDSTKRKDRNSEKRLDAEIEELKADRIVTQRERYFFMGMTAFGVAVATALAFLSTGQSEPGHYFTPGAGLIISGGGLYRLRALSSGKRAGRESHAEED